MDGREDESGDQAFHAQLLQGIKEGVEPRLMNLDDAVCLVLQALRDQATVVGREEIVVIPQVEPLGVPSSVSFNAQPFHRKTSKVSAWASKALHGNRPSTRHVSFLWKGWALNDNTTAAPTYPPS